jgi:hypothetical protein
MVTKIVSGKSMRGALTYNENKVEAGEASLLMASGFATDVDGMNLAQKLQRFENLTMLNERSKTNTLHITINFAAEDKLSGAQYAHIASTFMERIGFGDQPYLVYRHDDAAHPHLHLVTTNIRADGQRIDTHNIGYNLANEARREIEKEFGLVKAEGRHFSDALGIKAADPKKARYGQDYTKRAITNISGAVMRSYKFGSFSEYNAVLKSFNVTADRGGEHTAMYQKGGLLYSLLDEKGEKIGVPIKASAIYGKPTLANLEKRFERNKEARKDFKDNVRGRIDSIFDRYIAITKPTLIDELQKADISATFHQNKDGQVYGLTLIDHQHKAVFKGSDLGKDYTAKALISRVSDRDKKIKPDKRAFLKTKPQSNYLTKQPATSLIRAPEAGDFLKLALGRDKSGGAVAPSVTRPKRKKRNKQGIHF